MSTINAENAETQRTQSNKKLRSARLRNSAVPLLILAVFLVSAAAFQQEKQTAPPSEYIGDEKCLSCHEAQKNYSRTAHHLTSSLPLKTSIAGKFSEGKNVLKTSEPELQYRMEERSDGFYQTAVLGVPPDTVSISKRFDLVIGSGRKGQTYLHWDKDDQLFQLPVSYWTEVDHWVISPGYNDKVVNFTRPVPARCLECHSSRFEIRDPAVANRFSKSLFSVGLMCERCHGPGREHAELNADKDRKPQRQAIVNPAKLPRQRQMDLCSLCHGGIGVSTAPPFTYVAGNDLKVFLRLEVPKPSEPLDVHGNQIALLERSRCYQASEMTCSTCHNVHVPQRDVRDFSARCLTCHKVQSCGLFAKEGQKIANKCVDCHLPNQTSNVIVSTVNGVPIKPKVRNHWIKVYPEFRNLR